MALWPYGTRPLSRTPPLVGVIPSVSTAQAQLLIGMTCPSPAFGTLSPLRGARDLEPTALPNRGPSPRVRREGARARMRGVIRSVSEESGGRGHETRASTLPPPSI